jgi:hypothetical protein
LVQTYNHCKEDKQTVKALFCERQPSELSLLEPEDLRQPHQDGVGADG